MTGLTVPCRRCAHPRGRHEHYRPGTDCAHLDCPCDHYVRSWPWHHARTIATLRSRSCAQARHFYRADRVHLFGRCAWCGRIRSLVEWAAAREQDTRARPGSISEWLRERGALM